jgi:hypothetical protein
VETGFLPCRRRCDRDGAPGESSVVSPQLPGLRVGLPTQANCGLEWGTQVGGLVREHKVLRCAQDDSFCGVTAARKGSTPTTTIRLDPEDIARARAQAADRGLRYQTCLKMLIHQALGRAEGGGKGRRSLVK